VRNPEQGEVHGRTSGAGISEAGDLCGGNGRPLSAKSKASGGSATAGGRLRQVGGWVGGGGGGRLKAKGRRAGRRQAFQDQFEGCTRCSSRLSKADHAPQEW